MSTNTAVKKVKEVGRSPTSETGIVRAMTDAMTSDDVESMVSLFAPEGDWLIVATGESFRDSMRSGSGDTLRRGASPPGGKGDQTHKRFHQRRRDKALLGVRPYCRGHRQMASFEEQASSGTKIELPIVLICDIRGDKLVKIREYFDLQTATEPGVPHKLYS